MASFGFSVPRSYNPAPGWGEIMSPPESRGPTVPAAPRTAAPQFGLQTSKVASGSPYRVWGGSAGSAASSAPPSMGTLSDPGAAETFDRSAFSAPSAFDQFWNEVRGQWNTQNNTPAPQQAQQAYKRFQSQAPVESGRDPYYAAAFESGANDINKAYGARGMFNSSEALGAIGDFRGKLAADQAQNEADFRLRRLAEERAAAGMASTEQRTGSSDDLARILGFGGMAGDRDAGELARTVAGFNAALGVQGAEQGRERGALQDIMSVTGMGMPVVAGGMDSLISGDQQLFTDIMSLLMGVPREQYNQQERENEKFMGGVNTTLNAYKTFT